MYIITTPNSRRLLSVAAILFTACGGGGSSPTAPAQPSSVAGLSIAFKDPSGALAPRETVLRRELEAAFSRAAQEIDISGLTVEVSGDLGRIIPEWGMGGFTPSGRRVEMAIDPKLPEALLVERLASLLAHEFHHVARKRGPGYGSTLLEAMVSEGLADHFASELFGQPLPPWSVALAGREIDEWIDRARPEFDSKSYNHDAWFFGGSAEIPRWTGYTVGFRLVSDYQAANPGATAATLASAGANVFRPG